jgi:hypothetical protein
MEVPAVTAAEMREIDRIAAGETGPNLFQMMENAGRNLALQAIEVLGPDWRERHILVLAGGGGNGGGGICAARHLVQDAGVGNATREPSAERQPDTRRVWRRSGPASNQRMDSRNRCTSSSHRYQGSRGAVAIVRRGAAIGTPGTGRGTIRVLERNGG